MQAWVAYLALDMLLSVVACVETLADAVASTSGSACSEQLQLAPIVTAAGDTLGLRMPPATAVFIARHVAV
jgi:hypothetical protein